MAPVNQRNAHPDENLPMPELFGSDAYSPAEIAEKIENGGVKKARLPLLSMCMLGLLAGAFIGWGSLFYTLVVSDPTLGFAASRIAGGVVFSLGLILVIVAGAELFTGNNLLAMAWADKRITTGELLRNWVIVCCSNFVGGAGLAFLVFLSGHTDMNHGLVAEQYLKIANAKCSLPFMEALVRGALCNVLVCLAVWMAMAGRSVVDKAVAIIFPISAFVAAGFEHSVANFFFIPLAWMLKISSDAQGYDAISLMGFFHNIVPVILGNLLGGSVLVGMVYYVIYRRPT